jgi:hypothetical protein
VLVVGCSQAQQNCKCFLECAGKTGKEQVVKVHYVEGIANHIGPESCVVHREVYREALTGERIGQPLSRDRKVEFRVPTLFQKRKATRLGAILRALGRLGVVEDPGMCARSLYGNREISSLTSRKQGLARVGKARSRSR